MPTAYERLYFSAFSRRTVVASGVLLLSYWMVLAALHTLGGSLAWLRMSFYLQHLVTAVPLVVVLLVRLRPVANPDLRTATALINKTDLGVMLAWIMANLVFLRTYFSYFVPSYLVLYAYPEGKYGPPLLREQPFFIASFAILMELVGFIRPAWHYRRARPAPEEYSNIFAFGIEMIRLGARRSLDKLGMTFVLLFAENTILIPHTYALYALFVGTIHAVRRVPHSFYEFFDVRMLYHLLWAGLALLLLHTVIEIIVVYFFERCFHLCRGSSQANSLLISGLHSNKTGVQRQAIRELQYLVEDEPEWRVSFFEDFIGEEAASQVLCKLVVGMLQRYSSYINLINADLSLFSREYSQMMASAGINGNLTKVSSEVEAGIFSPRRKNIFESVLGKVQAKVDLAPATSSSGTTTSKMNAIPDVLEIKHAKKQIADTTSTTPRAPQFVNEPGLKMILAAMSRFNSYPTRVFAGIAMELIKSRWLGEEEPFVWLIDALATLVVASYEEDSHGQVQFVLDDIFATLAGLVQSMRIFEESPKLDDGRRVAEDLFGTLPSPVEVHARRLGNAAMAALESIIDRFADSLSQIKITPTTREKIRELGIVL